MHSVHVVKRLLLPSEPLTPLWRQEVKAEVILTWPNDATESQIIHQLRRAYEAAVADVEASGKPVLKPACLPPAYGCSGEEHP